MSKNTLSELLQNTQLVSILQDAQWNLAQVRILAGAAVIYNAYTTASIVIRDAPGANIVGLSVRAEPNGISLESEKFVGNHAMALKLIETWAYRYMRYVVLPTPKL